MENPITREEKILNAISSGEDLGFKPITREEMYLAYLAGIGEKPEKPITRKELFLDKIELGTGSGGVTINNQDKTITENGTYTADEGYTGLGTVTVDVQSAGGDEASVLDSVIENTVTEITSNATSVTSYKFYECSTIETAEFPRVQVIGLQAFRSCTNLTSVDCPLATTIMNAAFSGCSKLTRLNFPLVTSISNEAFVSCIGIANIKFPSLTELNASVFNRCTNLKTADFPLVINIGGYSLANCSKLKAVILRGETISTLTNATAFTSTPIASGTGYIYVPSALVDTYKSATNWSTYAAQFRALEDYTVDGTITGELDPTKI